MVRRTPRTRPDRTARRCQNVRLPDVGPVGQRHVVSAVDKEFDPVEGIGRTGRVQVEEAVTAALDRANGPGDGPCTRPSRRQ